MQRLTTLQIFHWIDLRSCKGSKVLLENFSKLYLLSYIIIFDLREMTTKIAFYMCFITKNAKYNDKGCRFAQIYFSILTTNSRCGKILLTIKKVR